MIRREAAAYRALDGAAGLPPFHGSDGPLRLVTGWLDAVPLAATGRGELPAERFERLERIVAGFHAAGVALGDLHQRDVLLTIDGDVAVVDLATALVLGERPSRWRRALFRRMCEQDRIAVARLRARFCGGDEAAAIEAVGAAAARRYRRARQLKAGWDRLRGRR